jgi:2-C-methyl-D-erythritol 4-phosphate cytidylyltransferase
MAGAGPPKQFLDLGGRPVLAWSLGVFGKMDEIDSVVVVCHGDFMELAEKIAAGPGAGKVRAVVAGGETRQESAFNGLKTLNENPPETVLIHDAARPFITAGMVRETIRAAREHRAATVAVVLADTLVKGSSGFVKGFVERAGLFRVQTPQGFGFGLIMEAHERAAAEGTVDATDDAQLIFALGHKVRVVPGSETNLKITTDRDLGLARALARELLVEAG